jgi:hypothetical protein
MGRLRDFVELVRAPAALSVPGDAVAGAAAGGALGPRTAGLAAASVFLYWAGMAANDWADRELDAIERPERPIPSGRISAQTALGVAAGLTAAGLGVAAFAGGKRALAVAVPLVGAIWAYDTTLKNTAAGPAGMAVCRGLDVLLGATPGRLRPALRPAMVVAAHTYAVTALSRHEVHGADRLLPALTMGATTLVAAAPTALAARAARADRAGQAFRDSVGVGAGNGGEAATRTQSRQGTSGRGTVRRGRQVPLLTEALSGWYASRFLAAQRKVLDDPQAGNVRASVGAGITSLPALQGALTSAYGAPVTGALVAAAAPLGRKLARAVSPT